MRTSRATNPVLALTILLAASPALAFEASFASGGAVELPAAEAGEAPASLSAMPLTPQSPPQTLMPPMDLSIPDAPTIGEKTTADEAFNMARNLYRRGEKEEAAEALQFAAGQGHVGAQWMIGRMYARGEGVAPDDLKAFEYFRGIVSNARVEDMDDSYEARQNAAYVSHALLQLGSYYREGIPGTHVKPNPQLAVSLYSRAAFTYGDPNAQFNLGMMYAEGNGVPKDPRRAMQFFNHAAKKGHAPSRALLGHMMFKGEGVKRQPERGLMWMNLARQAAEQSGEADAQWIVDLHDKALAQASEEERKGALGFLDRFFKN